MIVISRNLILQILLLVCLAAGAIFWGGTRLLPLSVMAACAGFAGLLLCVDPPQLSRSLQYVVLAIVVWSLACLFLSPNGVFGWKVFTLHILYLLCFFAAVKIAQMGKEGDRFLPLACLLAFGAVLYGYYRLDFGVEKILGLEQPGEYAGRMSGTFISPNHFAVFAAMPGLLLFGYAAQARGIAARAALAAGCFLSLLASVLSGSRSTLLGVLLVACVFFVFTKASPLGPKAKLAFAAAAAGAVLLSFFLHVGAAHRLIAGLWDPGMSARVKVWQDTAAMIAYKPLAGVGLGNFQWSYPQFRSAGIVRKVDFAHSDLLQTWAEGGLAALALWTVFFTVCGSSLRRPKDALGLAMVGALGMMLVVAVLDFPFAVPVNGVLFFLIMGTCVGRESMPAGAPMPAWVRWIVAAGLGLFLAGQCAHAAAEVWALQGTKARARLEWDKALDKFRTASRWSPRNSVLWKGMGEISYNQYLFSRRSNAEAGVRSEQFFLKALAIHPKDGSVWTALGLLLMHQGRGPEAEVCFRKALALDPNNGFYHDMMAKYLLSLGRAAEAKAHVEMALWLYPRDGIARALLQKIKRLQFTPQHG